MQQRTKGADKKNFDVLGISPKTKEGNSNRVIILEYIKGNSPISVWDLAKALSIARSTIYYAIRDFEFSGLIKTYTKVNESNRALRMIKYKGVKKQEIEEE